MSEDQHARTAYVAAQLAHVRAVNDACRNLSGKDLAEALRQADLCFEFHVKQVMARQ